MKEGTISTIEIRKAQTEKDIEGILSLQREHLKTPENSGKNWQDGFVTLQHTPAILQQMMERSSQIVAVDGDKVVGYSLCLMPDMASVFPLLDPMMEVFEEIDVKEKKLTDYSFVIGGQCCIDPEYRGQGILGQLYGQIKIENDADMDFCVTEILRSNPRSLKAHLKIGFERVYEYLGEKNMWDIVLWDWR